MFTEMNTIFIVLPILTLLIQHPAPFGLSCPHPACCHLLPAASCHHCTGVSLIGRLHLCAHLARYGWGALLSLLFRLTGAERRTIVIEVGMQNAAQAITVACSPLVFNNEVIAIPAIIYALMMNVILLIYVAMLKKE